MHNMLRRAADAQKTTPKKTNPGGWPGLGGIGADNRHRRTGKGLHAPVSG
jgi:hypothetical protein